MDNRTHSFVRIAACCLPLLAFACDKSGAEAQREADKAQAEANTKTTGAQVEADTIVSTMFSGTPSAVPLRPAKLDRISLRTTPD